MPSTLVKSSPLLTQAFDTLKTPFYSLRMPLSPAESRLHSALSDYLMTVRQGGAASMQAAWTEKLKSSLLTLENLESELAPHLDSRLRHFMDSKSYRKAHDYLVARSSELANSAENRQSCPR